MKNYRVFLCLLLVIAITATVVKGQSSLHSSGYDFKLGVYKTIEDFKKNTPLECHIDDSIVTGIQGICEQEIACLGGFAYESKSIWGLCLEGQPYIKYGNCFYPIKQIGMLSTFYFINTHKDNYLDKNNVVYRKVRDALISPVQKVIDIETGRILDQDGDPHEIVQIIKSDEHFKKEKIKMKNLGAYITQYNRRHRLNFE